MSARTTSVLIVALVRSDRCTRTHLLAPLSCVVLVAGRIFPAIGGADLDKARGGVEEGWVEDVNMRTGARAPTQSNASMRVMYVQELSCCRQRKLCRLFNKAHRKTPPHRKFCVSKCILLVIEDQLNLTARQLPTPSGLTVCSLDGEKAPTCHTAVPMYPGITA